LVHKIDCTYIFVVSIFKSELENS